MYLYKTLQFAMSCMSFCVVEFHQFLGFRLAKAVKDVALNCSCCIHVLIRANLAPRLLHKKKVHQVNFSVTGEIYKINK